MEKKKKVTWLSKPKGRSPLFYLWWWKKQWRLILGIIVAVILLIGYFLPEKMCFSLLKRELKKEEERREKENWIDRKKQIKGKPWQNLEKELKNFSQDFVSDIKKKNELEKEILELRKDEKKFRQELEKIEELEKEYFRNQFLPEWRGRREEISQKLSKKRDKYIKMAIY